MYTKGARCYALLSYAVFISAFNIVIVTYHLFIYFLFLSFQEFDRQAAKNVQKLFDEIDSALYELRPNQAENNKNECQEWGTMFPHLR